MNLNLFNNKSILEQEYILKYFYLLDPQPLISEIRIDLKQKEISKLDMSSETIDIFFHTVFDHMYSHASQYVKFIPVTGFKDCFFGEPGGKTKYKDPYFQFTAFAFVLKLALYNYCISEGFFHNLEQDYYFNRPELCAPLEVKYKKYFSSGFFSNRFYEKSSDLNSKTKEDSRQTWYHHKKNTENAAPKDFVYFVFNDCKKIADLDSSQTLVPWIYKFPIYTYFRENTVSSLSRNLSASSQGAMRNTLPLYIQLYRALLQDEKNANFTSSSDTFIFQTMNERYFGFSTFSYITDLIPDIDGSMTDLKSVPSKYSGSQFNNVLKELSVCPLVYSRHFFLKYALEALNDNDTLETKYLQAPSQSLMTHSVSSRVLSDTQKSVKGIELLDQFFQTLNQVVLPILSALWNTTLQYLIPDFMSEEPTTYFQTYIEKHLGILTADFTKFTDDEIYNCFQKYMHSKEVNPYWNEFVKDIENLYDLKISKSRPSSKDIPAAQQAIYSNRFLYAANNSFTSSLLRGFLLRPMEHATEVATAPYPFSYISEEESGSNNNPAINEAYNFQYKRAQEIFNLFHN